MKNTFITIRSNITLYSDKKYNFIFWDNVIFLNKKDFMLLEESSMPFLVFSDTTNLFYENYLTKSWVI